MSSLLSYLLLIINAYLSTIIADTITCNKSNSCKHQQITCESGEDCTVICIGYADQSDQWDTPCYMSIIHCPDNYDCNINVLYTAQLLMLSAAHTQIYGGDSRTLNIYSEADWSIASSYIECPVNGNCILFATKPTSAAANPYGYVLSDVTINATYGNLLNVTINGIHEPLLSAKIHCPMTKLLAINCVIDVSDGGDASVTRLFGTNANIYIVDYNRLYLSATAVSCFECTPYVYCWDYELDISTNDCELKLVEGFNDQWQCADTNKIFYCEITAQPTTDPSSTNAPSQYIAINSTFVILNTTTDNPSKEPTESSSNNPSVIPTVQPSYSHISSTNNPSKELIVHPSYTSISSQTQSINPSYSSDITLVKNFPQHKVNDKLLTILIVIIIVVATMILCVLIAFIVVCIHRRTNRKKELIHNAQRIQKNIAIDDSYGEQAVEMERTVEGPQSPKGERGELCSLCGKVSEEKMMEIKGIYHCSVCLQLNDKRMDRIVDKMFDANAFVATKTTTAELGTHKFKETHGNINDYDIISDNQNTGGIANV